jgi:ABC-type glycerol-3-phosphate transport system permease component
VKRAVALVAWALAIANVVPLWLVAKQALTPERESYAWPPTWWPETLTLENFSRATEVVPLVPGIALSAGVAVATVASTLALALPAAWVAARRPGTRWTLDAAMLLVRTFPPIALAIPLAVLFVRAGLYNGPLGIGLWLAHTLLALPFAFFALRGGFAAVPREIEEAAFLDGAAPRTVFLRVTLPLVRPSLATAAILVFLVSWDELAFALLLQVTNRPLPSLLYYLAAFGHPGLSSAVAVLMVVPAIAVVFLLEPAFRAGVLSGSGR